MIEYAFEKLGEKVEAADVQVGEVRAIRFVDVDIAFVKRTA